MKKIARAQTRRHPRGQAMVEYSFITWALALGLILGGSIRVPGMRGQSIFDMFIAAYQQYYDSFYFVLNMPFP